MFANVDVMQVCYIAKQYGLLIILCVVLTRNIKMYNHMSSASASSYVLCNNFDIFKLCYKYYAHRTQQLRKKKRMISSKLGFEFILIFTYLPDSCKNMVRSCLKCVAKNLHVLNTRCKPDLLRELCIKVPYT